MNLPTVSTSASALREAFGQSKVQETTGGIGGYIKFHYETGEFSFGRDQEEVSGDTVLVNVSTFCHGWVLWHPVDGANKNLVPFTQELPEPMPNVVHKGKTVEPSQGRAFQGMFMDGDEATDAFTFETNSYGGRQAVDALLVAVKARAAEGKDDLFPLVTLDSTSYENKSYNKTIHNPVFTIVGWRTWEGVEAADANEPKKLEADAPAEEKAAEEAPKPKRRRRRTAA